MSVLLSKQRLFVGFTNYHLEQSFLKSIFYEVWDKEPDYLNSSCSRFRQDITANPYIFRYWQLAKNLFVPMKRMGKFFFLFNEESLKGISKTLGNKSIKTICMNDSPLCSENDYAIINQGITKMLEEKFPQKSSFEL